MSRKTKRSNYQEPTKKSIQAESKENTKTVRKQDTPVFKLGGDNSMCFVNFKTANF